MSAPGTTPPVTGTAPPAGGPPPDPTTDDKPDKGYPADTAVAEMTAPEQAAYWKHQARKHERRSSDYGAAKAKADQYDALLASTQSEQEKAVEAARKEGSANTAAELTQLAAGERIVGLLVARGKTEDEADDIVADLNLSRYVKDGRPDREAIAKAIDRLAPRPAKGGGAGRFADLGQGQRTSAPSTPGEQGRAEAARRFPTKS